MDYWLIVLGLIIGGISMWLLMWFLKRQIKSRLAQFNADISEIGASGNLSKRFKVEGKDELSNLATAINRMLESIEHSQAERRLAEEESRKNRDHFEDLLEERTSELKTVNKKLQQEITERKRVEDELSWQVEINKTMMELSSTLLSQASVEDISSLVFEHVKNLTNSPYGYVGYVDSKTGYLVCPTMTRDIMDTCRVKDKNNIIKEFRGLFGWVITNHKSILTNSPVDDPRSTGTPANHIPIHRFLSAPALLKGRLVGELSVPSSVGNKIHVMRYYDKGTLVGQIALANSDRDYTEKDLALVERLADIYAIAINRYWAEENLQISEEKYRSLVESTEDSIYMVDSYCEYLFMNSKQRARSGIVDYLRHSYGDFHSAEETKRFSDRVKHIFETERPEQYEYENKGKWFLQTLSPVKDLRTDKVTAVTVVSTDITARKKIEEMRAKNEYLAFVSKSKSEFLANMSHELRTPLNSIIGFSELLKQKVSGELNEKQEHYVDNVLTSSNFLLDLISDILDLSKVEAGKIELLIEKISVPATINETLTLIKEKAVVHNIILKKEFDPELEFIEADKMRFKQILFNLLSNAVKFSKKDGGTVTVTVKRVENMAQISVSDTGIGIREEDVAKLFKEFEQLDSGITRKYGGTGLGLAISKKLVELHGGNIKAESKYGEGSTFTFLIPIKKTGDIDDKSTGGRRYTPKYGISD